MGRFSASTVGYLLIDRSYVSIKDYRVLVLERIVPHARSLLKNDTSASMSFCPITTRIREALKRIPPAAPSEQTQASTHGNEQKQDNEENVNDPEANVPSALAFLLFLDLVRHDSLRSLG